MEQKNTIFINNCPVCGSDKFELFLKTKDYFLTNEEFTLVRCLSCSFVFTNPRPPDEELSKYYKSSDYLSHTARKRNAKDIVYQALRAVNIRKKYKLVNRFAKGKTILDIGSGTGELLAYFKKQGWNVKGIEPDRMARNFAREKHYLEIYENDKLSTFPDKSFDIITLWHVLEHIPDLNKTIENIREKLTEDGYCIIAVPNIESTDFKHYQDKWAALDVPRHLYHFSPDTIRLLLDKHGFKIVETQPMKFDAYYVSLLSEKYLNKKFPPLNALRKGYGLNKKAKKKNNYSSMIFVAKQK